MTGSRSTSSSSSSPSGGPGPLLEVGHVAKAHGLRGEVVVALSTNRPERVAVGSVLHLDREPGTVTVTASRPHQKRHVVRFAGIDTREAAEALHGAVLTAEPLDDPDTLWVHELVGSTVVDQHGAEHGRVTAVEVNPASDLLVLDGGGLVPLTFVVDHHHDRIRVDVPDGLL